MKILKKLKFLILLVNLSLIACGVLFLVSFLKKTPVECKLDYKIEERKAAEKYIVEELSTCQNDLFLIKNELEQTKNIPDTRKDIISLLLILKDFEKDLGQKRNFSNGCVKVFSLSSRIQVVQEYVLKYKQQFFESNCIIDNNEDILQMIVPFQVKILQEQRKNEQKEEKIIKKVLNEIKYQLSKLFVESKIQKSDLEIAIENEKYNEALQILISGNFEKNDEFNKLYNSISTLKNMKEMIDGIYEILKIKS